MWKIGTIPVSKMARKKKADQPKEIDQKIEQKIEPEKDIEQPQNDQSLHNEADQKPIDMGRKFPHM